MSVQSMSLRVALQGMLDTATEPLMVAAADALRNGGVLTTWGMAHRPASELAITYALRLEVMDRVGIDMCGMPEAILSFDRHGSEPIDMVTIEGVEREYLVFFNDDDGSLVACISLPAFVGRRLP